MTQGYQEVLFGKHSEPARCEVTVPSNGQRCPELAWWILDNGGKVYYTCDRCVMESIRRLTSHDRAVVVSRLPRRSR